VLLLLLQRSSLQQQTIFGGSMIDKSKLRGSDIITGSIFLVMGILIVAFAFRMPLRDSYGGVQSVWYVSPALLPIIIGSAMILLATAILLYAIKNDGIAQFKALCKERFATPLFDESGIRFAAIMVPLFSMVYINLTRIDFFLCIIYFLAFTISVFYFENPQIMRKTLILYTVQVGAIILLAVFKLDKVLDSLFIYTMDSIALIFIIVLFVYIKKLANKQKNADELKKKYAQMIRISLLTPLFIVPVFRFALRIPMPKEGAIMNIMYLIYYAIK
jgi:hypothetical protein